MLSFGVLATLLAVATADSCYKQVEDACKGVTDTMLLETCNAKYGAFNEHQVKLQSYANGNIEASFTYLLMSSYFGNYIAQREGFKKLYRQYSDKAWEDGVNIIKYIAKRGGSMNFNQTPQFKLTINENRVVDLSEINSLAKALKIQKELANEANHIHSVANLNGKYDAAVAHYIEEHFLESQSERVRDLAGHVRDLKNLLVESNPAVSVFLFDEFLKKTV